MIKREDELGFSAVELLITLFIAFLFVMMGYQLYSVSIKDGADARSRAKASNVAYKYLQQNAYGNCSNAGVRVGPDLAIQASEGLKGAKLTVTAICVNTSVTNGLLLITSTVKYGNPVQEVSHAVYAKQ